MDRKHISALFLLASIALAGCTALPGGGDGGDEQDGFQMTQSDGLTAQFRTLSTTYAEDGQIVLELSLQNTGQADATNIRTELYGASFLVGESPSSAASSSLDPVDEAAEQPGERTTARWNIRNPVDLAQGDTQDYPAGVRTLYNYSTTSTGSFRVVPREGFEGGSQQISTDNSAGPLFASFKIDSPKPVSRPEGDRVSVSIPVLVRNVGDGTVAQHDSLSGTEGDVHMNVSFPNAGSVANIEECGGGSTSAHSFRLFDGQREVICTASISTDVFDTQLNIEATFDYSYFETDETSFTIEGMAGDQSG